jgi:hypothetical protein
MICRMFLDLLCISLLQDRFQPWKLHRAVEMSDISTLAKLVEAGASVNQRKPVRVLHSNKTWWLPLVTMPQLTPVRENTAGSRCRKRPERRGHFSPK